MFSIIVLFKVGLHANVTITVSVKDTELDVVSMPKDTRMHSSRMRTAPSSSRPWGSPPGTSRDHAPPLGVDTPGTMHTLEQTPPRPCTPGTINPRGSRHPQNNQPPGEQAPHYGQTHACKHITLSQTSFAGGKNGSHIFCPSKCPPNGAADVDGTCQRSLTTDAHYVTL